MSRPGWGYHYTPCDGGGGGAPAAVAAAGAGLALVVRAVLPVLLPFAIAGGVLMTAVVAALWAYGRQMALVSGPLARELAASRVRRRAVAPAVARAQLAQRRQAAIEGRPVYRAEVIASTTTPRPRTAATRTGR
jgi:hypothetical protein